MFKNIDILQTATLADAIELKELLTLWHGDMTCPSYVVKKGKVELIFIRSYAWIEIICFIKGFGVLAYPSVQPVKLYLKFIDPEDTSGYLFLSDLGEATTHLCKTSRFESPSAVYAQFRRHSLIANDPYTKMLETLPYLHGYLEEAACLRQKGDQSPIQRMLALFCAAYQIGSLGEDEEFCR